MLLTYAGNYRQWASEYAVRAKKMNKSKAHPKKYREATAQRYWENAMRYEEAAEEIEARLKE